MMNLCIAKLRAQFTLRKKPCAIIPSLGLAEVSYVLQNLVLQKLCNWLFVTPSYGLHLAIYHISPL